MSTKMRWKTEEYALFSGFAAPTRGSIFDIASAPMSSMSLSSAPPQPPSAQNKH